MNRNFIAAILISAFSIVTITLVFADQPISIKLSKQDQREVKNFNGVAAGGSIHVIVTLGSTEGVRFEGDSDAIATLVTEVKSGILIIRPQNSWASWTRRYENKKITAYVSAKTIKSLTMSGSGTLSVTGKINSTALATTLSGSGTISADAEVNSYSGVISGSGNLNISGSAKDASIVISGSGSFKKGGFTVGDLSAVISGSGAINVNAEDNINAVISGSGSINYSGNAKVEKRVTGSGRVRKL